MNEQAMTEVLEMLEFAKNKLFSADKDLVTYADDGEADHSDGQYCGRVEAYKEIIRFCGDRLSKLPHH